jgi:uncharacterized protein (DUF362 family)
MEIKSSVVIVKDVDIKRRTLEALRLVGGIDGVVSRGDKVFLKPNLVDGAPFETGEIVQLEVMEVLVEEAFRAGASEVIIGETPTWRRKTSSIELYEQMTKRLNATFLDLSKYPFVDVEVKDPVLFNKVRLSKILDDCDVFISVPTLKTHVQAGITVSIKNMFGLIPGRPGTEDKGLYHRLDRIEEAILDLYQACKPDLIVVDGTYCTFHTGPRPIEDFTETLRLDLTLAGFDPIAIDTVGAKILGIDPKAIRYLRWGEEKGLGTGNMDDIEVLGTPIEEAFIRKAVDTVEFANVRMKNVKILNHGACTGCLKYAPQIRRFGEETLGDKAVFVMGPKANANNIRKNIDGDEKIILCGYCAAPTFYNELQGDFIPGCPPTIEDLQTKLKEISINSRRPLSTIS